MVRKDHNYQCSFSKTPSLGSWVQVSGSGSVTLYSGSAHTDGNNVKATSLKDPAVSAFHTLSSCHPLPLGLLDQHLCPMSQEMPVAITINCNCGNKKHSLVLPLKPLRSRQASYKPLH